MKERRTVVVTHCADSLDIRTTVEETVKNVADSWKAVNMDVL